MFSSNASQVSADANYIEDVFSTWLYTGNGSTQTITNGIDLAGEGGIVWVKVRNQTFDHSITYQDSPSTLAYVIPSGGGSAATSWQTDFAYNSNGFSLNNSYGMWNGSGNTYASWTFRKQPQFFDYVTYTGNGVAGRTVAHNLGSVPGCIMVKRTDQTSNWQVYHRANTAAPETDYLVLNSTAATADLNTVWNDTAPTDSVFSVGTNATVNASGGTYVAYLFAHDAGGFGESGEDNVISCGSFTTDGSGNATVNLGYEPQWVLYKHTAIATDWNIFDNMRGMPVGSQGLQLKPNSTAADNQTTGYYPTSTGFQAVGLAASQPQIYIAIRRGPMKTPTTGTSVFDANSTAFSVASLESVNFPIDFSLAKSRGSSSSSFRVTDRLRGFSDLNTSSSTLNLLTPSTAAEVQTYPVIYQVWNNSWRVGEQYGGTSSIYYGLRRAPGFFDVVCYTGTGVARTVAHNLAAVPEMMIMKIRSSGFVRGWNVRSPTSTPTNDIVVQLNTTSAATDEALWNDVGPTSTVFTVSGDANVNASGQTYVAYLFASAPGVSKVGSYTGTGTTQQINCGFTGGARFVLIKRTDSTGDWYVWDSARGIVAGNDPYLLLNSTAAEVTSTDYVDTYSAGFELSSTAPAAINASGGTFIFLAIA